MSRRTQDKLSPGATIGILGGGQLGRMLAVSASRLGFETHIFTPEAESPASSVATYTTQAKFTDVTAVHDFAKACDVVTYEFENVPAMTAKSAASAASLRPGVKALDVAQDRVSEKTFIRDWAKVPVTEFLDITSVYDLRRACKILGLPAILKTRRLGYDGRGQVVIRSETEITGAFEAMNGAPAILERFVPFAREVSIIGARSVTGEVASYPLIENVHKDQILHTSTAPATRDNGQAQALATKIMTALDYVGVLAVEFFELADGALMVNEIAPRVHNSGHWTQDAGCIDQFELHIRAIAGWPLGDTTPRFKMQMTNLIGPQIEGWTELATRPGTFIHLYGKRDARPGRKMGHINTVLGGA